jgi:hypothetical protein
MMRYDTVNHPPFSFSVNVEVRVARAGCGSGRGQVESEVVVMVKCLVNTKAYRIVTVTVTVQYQSINSLRHPTESYFPLDVTSRLKFFFHNYSKPSSFVNCKNPAFCTRLLLFSDRQRYSYLHILIETSLTSSHYQPLSSHIFLLPTSHLTSYLNSVPELTRWPQNGTARKTRSRR